VTEVRCGDGGDGPIEAGPAPAVTLVNEAARRRVFVIEDVQWVDDALQPVHLFDLQEFRDLFSAEQLAADVELHVGEQCILFSDIVGSTRFYESHGDSRAFAAVKRHFRAIYEEVGRHRGVVVKTIGDAAMAAFADPADAVRAALGVQRRFGAGGEHEGLRVRISLNQGPCIAVNLNSGIDYFGRTVNLAAKLQAWASAGQIVFPAALRDDPRLAALLDAEQPSLEELAATLPSATEPIAICRWDTDGIAAQQAGAPPSAAFY
jgi:class 3 adenylate cyclase